MHRVASVEPCVHEVSLAGGNTQTLKKSTPELMSVLTCVSALAAAGTVAVGIYLPRSRDEAMARRQWQRRHQVSRAGWGTKVLTLLTV